MLSIRLVLRGKKSQRSYRIIAAEARSKLNGHFAYDLGSWSPLTKKLNLNQELYSKLISQGAKPSSTIQKIVKNQVS